MGLTSRARAGNLTLLAAIRALDCAIVPGQRLEDMAMDSPSSFELRLAALGLRLPEPPKPVAAYVPAVRTGNLVFISGQLPLTAGQLLAAGPVPSQVPIDQAQEAAAQCVLNGLSVLKTELSGDLRKLNRVVRIAVYVQCDDGFKDQPLVANGASELLERLLGDAGKHARAAVGVNALPMGASVEVEFVFEVS